jgi:hypothetical protein
MTDYSKGKIYMIEPRCSHEPNEIYYGSTKQEKLSVRYAGHIRDYNRWKEGKCNYITYFELFNKYGIENCPIVFIENYPCNLKCELTSREAHYIRNNPCVNKVIPDRTMKEWRDDNKEHIKEYTKQYNQEHIQEIAERTKEYRLANPDKNKEQCKQYRLANPDKVKEYRKSIADKAKEYKKQYRLDNAVKIKEQKQKAYQAKKEALSLEEV